MGSPQHRISPAKESQSANFRNPKRKKIETRPRLPCKIQYLLTANHRAKSSASEFFTDDWRKLEEATSARESLKLHRSLFRRDVRLFEGSSLWLY